MTFTPGSEELFELGLFTGIPQHETFCRIDELVSSRRMGPSSSPRPWPEGEPVALPATFAFDGGTSVTTDFLAGMTTEHSDVAVTLFSALKKSGVGDVAQALHGWTHAPRPAPEPTHDPV